MTHPKGVGFGFEEPRPRKRRFTRGGGREVPPPPAAEDYPLPELGEPVHLQREMDCPRCLDERPVGARGLLRVAVGLHLQSVDGPTGRLPALLFSLVPAWKEGAPPTACSTGCDLTEVEWETILNAAFLDVCERYAAVSRSLEGEP